MEGHANNPSNPYSASKEGAEALAKSFAFSFGMPITIIRTMNVFGERQHPEKYVPMVIGDILAGRKVTIHGTGRNKEISSRCWIHSREVANALLYVNEKGEFLQKEHQDDTGYGVYHIVGDERDALEIADLASNIINGRDLEDKEITWVNFHETRPGHDLRYALSGEKLKSSGFEYSLGLKESFDKMAQWMIKPENRRWLNV